MDIVWYGMIRYGTVGYGQKALEPMVFHRLGTTEDVHGTYTVCLYASLSGPVSYEQTWRLFSSQELFGLLSTHTSSDSQDGSLQDENKHKKSVRRE